jgi:uncharacterized protein
MPGVCVAFSGGVDSTFLLKVAKDVLGDDVLAVTATSPTYPESELKEARRLAESIGVEHLMVDSNELKIPGFSENSPNRCYHCKSDLFRKLRAVAGRRGGYVVADGSNLDDAGDYRPGREAAKKLGVRSPLAEARLTKSDIRALSRQMGLSTWDKPSFACLSSRFPYGEPITEEKLRMVEAAEGLLKECGFTQFRVRYHDGLARLELLPGEMLMLGSEELRLRIYDDLRKLGFTYVSADLKGYRTGSMNEVLGA